MIMTIKILVIWILMDRHILLNIPTLLLSLHKLGKEGNVSSWRWKSIWRSFRRRVFYVLNLHGQITSHQDFTRNMNTWIRLSRASIISELKLFARRKTELQCWKWDRVVSNHELLPICETCHETRRLYRFIHSVQCFPRVVWMLLQVWVHGDALTVWKPPWFQDRSEKESQNIPSIWKFICVSEIYQAIFQLQEQQLTPLMSYCQLSKSSKRFKHVFCPLSDLQATHTQHKNFILQNKISENMISELIYMFSLQEGNTFDQFSGICRLQSQVCRWIRNLFCMEKNSISFISAEDLLSLFLPISFQNVTGSESTNFPQKWNRSACSWQGSNLKME